MQHLGSVLDPDAAAGAAHHEVEKDVQGDEEMHTDFCDALDADQLRSLFFAVDAAEE